MYAHRVSTDIQHTVLRIRPRASAGAWWSAARLRHDAPPAVGALLAGRARVELTPEEADQAITWARSVDGWAAAEPKPLFIHQADLAPS
jgi:hypothetical protein